MSEKLVPVYRVNQLTMISPCLLGDLCPTCALHASCHAGDPCNRCLRGKPYDCERQMPAEPAYKVTVGAAMRMLEYRVATFIHRNTALRLTDERLAHLRDLSCQIDEEVIMQYIARIRRARRAVNIGWGQPPKVTKLPRWRTTKHRFRYK